MKTIKITVTEADIRKGKPKRCRACPIYLAARRAGLKRFIVGLSRLAIWNPKPCSTLDTLSELPAKAIRFIARFDAGKPVKPFSFNLKLPK